MTTKEKRQPRGVGVDTKICEQCGQPFVWPKNYTRSQWEAQRFCSRACAHESLRLRNNAPPRQCAICGGDYWSRFPNRLHCDTPACKREYRSRASAAMSARMRADYAAGKRKGTAGISPRERILWPLLAPHGWVWRLRWIEQDAEFELDFAHRDLMLDVEVDGVEHREPRGVKRDAIRDGALKAQGWRILRIPNADVDADPEAVVARIMQWTAR